MLEQVLCINDGEIPLTIDGFGDKKQISVGLIVVDCLMEGYTKVPYECVSGDKYKVCCTAYIGCCISVFAQ